MSTVAIFGGSFDPPHVGHVLAVRYLLSVGAADRVIVVPVFQHAFNKLLAPFEVRMKLVELAFQEEGRATVSSIERELPAPNYTLNTVRALKVRYPSDEMRLVVGADVLQDVDKWHHFDELSQEAPLLVLGRAGVDHPDAPRVYLPEVSSSEIRRLLASAQDTSAGSAVAARDALSTLRKCLPAHVLEAILRENWYG